MNPPDWCDNVVFLETQIGQGSYGTVWKGFFFNAKDGKKLEIVAKIVRDERGRACDTERISDEEYEHDKVLSMSRMEGAFLDMLHNSDFVVKKYADRNYTLVQGRMRLNPPHFFLMEPLKISLLDLLAKFPFTLSIPPSLHWDRFVEGIAGQLFLALDLLQENGVMHRDIKPGNILLADDGRLILCDFGFATRLDRHAKDPLRFSEEDYDEIQTPPYRAPELLCKVDEYAGLVTLEVASRRSPLCLTSDPLEIFLQATYLAGPAPLAWTKTCPFKWTCRPPKIFAPSGSAQFSTMLPGWESFLLGKVSKSERIRQLLTMSLQTCPKNRASPPDIAKGSQVCFSAKLDSCAKLKENVKTVFAALRF